MKVKAISRNHYIDPETNQTKQIEKSMIVNVPDEELLHLEGYAATNYLYNKCDSAWNVMALSRIYEIIEDGLAKDIPYLEQPFETIKEMREYLKRPEIIAEFDEEV